MKYFKNIILGMFFMFLFCSFNPESEDYEKLANKITHKVANQLLIEKNMHLIGTGGQMMDDIQMMAMSFEVYRPIDVLKARRLLISAMQKYLSEINDDEKVRPYLHQYPFTDQNIEIDFWIRNPDGSRVLPDKIYYVSAINGILRYYIDDPENFSRKIVHQETYEEALRAVSSKEK
jgi:hypothetical protein